MKLKLNSFPGRQDGVLTIFSAVLVLFLMTVMLIYASRVTVFDQRVSNNEQRYRVAFNLAESAAQATLEMIEAAGPAVTSSSGWRNGIWQTCSATVPYCTADLPDDTFAVPGWYIHDLGAVLGGLGSPIDFDAAIGDVTEGQPNATARVSLAMQFVDPGGIATGPPGSEAEEADARTLFMVYGYGFSDCTDVDDTNTCQGRATVAQPLGTFKQLAGAPPVPLTSKSLVNGIGSMTIVGNPDAGGVGVMTTVWANDRPGFGGVSDGNGTWQTCQLGDWYDTDDIPADIACPQVDNNGVNACVCDGVELVSYAQGGTSNLELDVLEDPAFPEDLFEVFFNLPKQQYRQIKDQATILEDCSSLGPDSAGLYWIEGDECDITNGTIGAVDHPVILVSAAKEETRFNGGTLWGVLVVTDVEEREADGWPPEAPTDHYSEFIASGNNVVYGAIIVDAYLEQLNGTFDLVYADGVLGRAAGIGGVAAIDGGWRDFDIPEFAAPAAGP